MNLRVMAGVWVVVGGALALGACKNTKSGETIREVPVKLAERKADPGRIFEAKAGTREVASFAVGSILAGSREVVDGHTYVSVPFSSVEDPSVLEPRLNIGFGVVDGGVAVPCKSVPEGGAGFIVALRGDASAEFGLTWYNAAQGYQPWDQSLRSYSAQVVQSDAKAGRELRSKFYECLEYKTRNRWMEMELGARGFYEYVSARSGAIARGVTDPSADPRGVSFRNRRPRGLEETMEMYTGMMSVEEALQADRALRLGADDPTTRTIDPASIEPVGLEAHPWEQMIGELGKESAHAPLAARVPHDMAYAHFHDIRDFVRTARRAQEVLLPVTRVLEQSEGTSEMTARYEDALLMRRTSISETLGNLAAKSFAMAVSDPFLREGADVTLIFEIGSKDALMGTLDRFVEEARAKRADLARSEYEVSGRKVTLWSTPDGVHSRHMLELDGVLFVSNARAAIERFVAVADGKDEALTARGDFRYMRALYPFSKTSEDGFVFIGDDFVASAISPRAKILSSRRMRARADLMAVNYAALMHGWLEGAPPKSLDEMVASGALPEWMTTTFEGEAITFSVEAGASSATWGTPSRLTPLAEVELGKVTQAEVDAYAAFRDSYQQYWSQFVDPIAGTLSWDGDTSLELDARMLPLIEGTAYDELVALVGRQLYTMPRPPEAGASYVFAVGENASLRKDLNQYVYRLLLDKSKRGDWVGDWVAVGVDDRAKAWDLAMYSYQIPTLSEFSRSHELFAIFETAALTPGWAMVDVKDAPALEHAIESIRERFSIDSMAELEWVEEPEGYRGIKTTAIKENKAVTRPDSKLPAIEVYFGIADGTLVAALGEEVFEARVDDALDGRTPKGTETSVEAIPGRTPEGASQTSVALEPWNEDSQLMATIAGIMEADAMRGARASSGMLEVLARGLGPARLGSPEAIRAWSLTYMGLAPHETHGGGWSIGGDGVPVHARYGSMRHATVLELPVAGSPVTELLETLDLLDMGLSFDGDGAHRGLHTHLKWVSR